MLCLFPRRRSCSTCRTDLSGRRARIPGPSQDQFERINASLPDKGFESAAWIYVPGENAAASTVPDAPPADPPGEIDLNRMDRSAEPDAPHLPTVGQVFQHITAQGPAAFGNGNTVTTYGSADDAQPGRSSR